MLDQYFGIICTFLPVQTRQGGEKCCCCRAVPAHTHTSSLQIYKYVSHQNMSGSKRFLCTLNYFSCTSLKAEEASLKPTHPSPVPGEGHADELGGLVPKGNILPLPQSAPCRTRSKYQGFRTNQPLQHMEQPAG